MSLQPKFAGLKIAGAAEARHTLEIYLDYVCPFAAKMFKTFYGQVLPSLSEAASSRLTVIFRPQIQPWHPSSTLAIEAALAVLKLAPAKFQQFSAALFEHQKEYFDANVVNETRNQTYERLAKLASKEAGVDEEAVMGLLRISDKPGAGGDLNGGNGVTADVKIMTKATRVVGVHVTPTVFFNGIEERSISSSFTRDQWLEWVEKNVV
ncbi:Disulfide bond formation protein D [Trichophyton interdigitale]|uniref:Disulfide bond formation protein D n=1 Tax=Trichophyton interdigitale TaxID=101480 RepID=A0A9P5CZL6_9EURO|nr:Disulfide bond formation protein D [Trichophyton interdigitale]KAF3900625.1 Disulfide bond formation protein D [Trichophyton interdigitale]KAG8211522.1 Disulfide bond formation protein D [Trichophyton interdigitale]